MITTNKLSSAHFFTSLLIFLFFLFRSDYTFPLTSQQALLEDQVNELVVSMTSALLLHSTSKFSVPQEHTLPRNFYSANDHGIYPSIEPLFSHYVKLQLKRFTTKPILSHCQLFLLRKHCYTTRSSDESSSPHSS